MSRYLLISIFLSMSLFARLNPFEVVDNKQIQELEQESSVISHETNCKESQKVLKKPSNEYITNIEKKIVKSKSSKLVVKNFLSKGKKYNILPLVTIEILDKKLTISTTSYNRIIKYYEDSKNNIFVFDFKANIGVPTAREKFHSAYFKSYTVGNHPKEKFFRVVIPVKDGVENYKIVIKNNIGTIIRK